MILHGESDIDRLLDAGDITLDDAAEVQTFMDFLAEAPRPPLPHEREPGFVGPLPHEDTRFIAAWGDYMRGEP